jgi:hypothetical protein
MTFRSKRARRAGSTRGGSCDCWAMYLLILRRYVEHGEQVAYEERLDV